MAQVLRGEMGYSFWTKDPISRMILRWGPISAQIAFFAIALSRLIGVPIELISAYWRNSFLDQVSRLGITVFLAVPSFWLGLLIILFTVLVLRWRPPLAIIQFWEDPGANFILIALPSMTLGLGIPPPDASGGNMLGGVTATAFKPPWWLVAFPGLAITFAIMTANLFGDALRASLDPKLRQRID